jgi:hypothetical protein
MRSGTLAAVALVFVVAGCGTHASVKKTPPTTAFKATLNVGQELPTPTHFSVSAEGRFSGRLSGNTLRWTLTFVHLTGPVTAAYLNLGTKSQTGTVLAALCTQCMSPAHGITKLTAAETKDLKGGRAYVNVHTFKDPRGEIRGQIR